MLKRLLLIFAFIPTLVWAQSTTPNLGLQIPATGSNNWYIPLNFDFSSLDLYLSGHKPIPGLAVTGNVTIGGSLTAGQIIGTGGSIFATAANAQQYSPVYYSQSPNGTAFAGVAPFTGFAYYRGNGPPRVASQADLNTLIGGAACGTAGTAYSPQAGNCIAVGSGAVAPSAQYTIPFFSTTGTSNALAGASGISTNSAGDSLTLSNITASGTVSANIIVATSILGGAALSVQGTSQVVGSFFSTSSTGSGISLAGSTSGVDTWQMNSLANNHLQFTNTTHGSGSAFDLTAAGVATATSFAGGGAALTGLNGANISTGNIPVARIATALTAPGPIGGTTPGSIAVTTLTATGNITAQGTVNSTANTSPASVTNTGISLVGQGGVADVVYYDSTRTTDNRTVDSLWSLGNYQMRFKNDAQSSATPFFTATGGFAAGITGLLTNSGTGQHTNSNTAQINTIFTGSSATGTAISIRGTAAGVTDWRLLSDATGKLQIFNGSGSPGNFTLDASGNLGVQGALSAVGNLSVGGGNLALVQGGGGINAVCFSVSSGCATHGVGSYNGVSVDVVDFPNRLEIQALQTIQFFVNNALGPDIQNDGTLNLSMPLSINASGNVASTKTADHAFPIKIAGTTYYMLLATSP